MNKLKNLISKTNLSEMKEFPFAQIDETLPIEENTVYSNEGNSTISRFQDNLIHHIDSLKTEQKSDLLKDINVINSDLTFSALPVKQTFSLPLISKKTDLFDENSLPAIMNKISNADDAFLNSILAYSCYKEKLWTLDEMDKDLNQMSVRVENAMKDPNELYKLKIWFFNKSFFSRIKDHHFMASQGRQMTPYGFEVDYEFKNGQYSALEDLAHASVLTSQHPSGEGKVLNIAFRGTEFSRLPKFLLKAYPDMIAYYQNFLPFEEAVLKYARDPKNNIKEIQVSGHSLGGAMVQEFLNRNPEQEGTPPIHGYTFGSPGSKKNFFVKFLNIGYHLFKHHTLVIEKPSIHHDSRMNEFYHNNDPVPRIGMLGYARNGTAHNLFDKVYEDAKIAKLEKKGALEKLPLFGQFITYCRENVFNKLRVQFHDSKRYSLNIRDIIETHYKTYPYLTDQMNKKTSYWQSYVKIENNFRNLSIRYKTAFEQLFKEQYPSLNPEQINHKILKMREQMKYDSEATLILAKKHTNISYHEPYFGNGNTKLPLSDITEDIKERAKAMRKKYAQEMDERASLFKP